MTKFYFKKADSEKCRKETDEYIKKKFMTANRKDIFGTVEYLIEYNINRLFEDEDFIKCIKSTTGDDEEPKFSKSFVYVPSRENIDMIEFKKAYTDYDDYRNKFYRDIDNALCDLLNSMNIALMELKKV